MEIKNRFIRSATTSYWSDKRGIIRPEIIELYKRLAKGGVGLIIKGHLFVKESGKAHVGMAGLSADHHIPKLKKLTDEVHKNEGKIAAQLNHGGLLSLDDRAGPSEYPMGEHKSRALAIEEIHEIVESFGQAAERAITAGFDCIQIHGAHGYLISQFLSRLTNRRTDEWGGSLKNRMRLLLEVYDIIRKCAGEKFPIMLKMNCDDFSPKGFTIDDSVRVAEMICRRGLHTIEVSGGGIGGQEPLRQRARSLDNKLSEVSFAGHVIRIRKATKPASLALVHGIRSLECMEALVNNDLVDLISMSRPFIRESDFVKKLKAGQRTSTCTSCNKCISRDVFGKTMLRCNLNYVHPTTTR